MVIECSAEEEAFITKIGSFINKVSFIDKGMGAQGIEAPLIYASLRVAAARFSLITKNVEQRVELPLLRSIQSI